MHLRDTSSNGAAARQLNGDSLGDELADLTFADLRQNAKGHQVTINRKCDAKLTNFGQATLKDRYVHDGEEFQDVFARVALAYGDSTAHAQRLYDYISQLWFMPSTPVLSNGGSTRGLPISCFLNETTDSLSGIVELWNENIWLAARGGGIGSYWGNLRSVGERIGSVGKTSGIIPFLKVMDSMTLAISQGSLRRGSAAVYLPVDHPEIEEFIELRKPTGGDVNRRALNLHHGVVISDAFMHAVECGDKWYLRSPKTHEVMREIGARDLWARLLTMRIEQGEPYLLFIDSVNRALPEHQRLLGLTVKTSNLCSEITLPTGVDHLGNHRTAVCCLSSVNLEYFEQWQGNSAFIPDVMRFLDNVLEDFITRAPEEFAHATYAARRERSVGLGVMGYHSFLQQKRLPFDSLLARSWNVKIFRHLRQEADRASKDLARERGPCEDAAEKGYMERFSTKLAIAPTASISIICGGASPGIEPISGNSFTHKTLSGSFEVRNRHLREILDGYDADNDETWARITNANGSVAHLGFLSEDEKAVYRTAFEIDPMAVINRAAERSEYVCQAQSVNVFLPPDIHKSDLHQIHYQAWKKGLKSLYYCRSISLQRAESIRGGARILMDGTVEGGDIEEALHQSVVAEANAAAESRPALVARSAPDECEFCQ